MAETHQILHDTKQSKYSSYNKIEYINSITLRYDINRFIIKLFCIKDNKYL